MKNQASSQSGKGRSDLVKEKIQESQYLIKRRREKEKEPDHKVLSVSLNGTAIIKYKRVL